ncbi:MAG: hypothetical protein ACHQ1G_02235, partial [Planctomycetota bacterium]
MTVRPSANSPLTASRCGRTKSRSALHAGRRKSARRRRGRTGDIMAGFRVEGISRPRRNRRFVPPWGRFRPVTCLTLHYHELALKGANRPRFVRALVVNARRALGELGPCRVAAAGGRVLVETDADPAAAL